MKLNNIYFLLRHGQARSNKYNFVSCWPEKVYNPLTEKGLREIKTVAVKLKKEKIDLIFASDLLRTKQTAEIIAKKLGLNTIFDKKLREIEFGKFNGGSGEKWEDFFETIRNKKSGKSYGMENYKDVRKKAKTFIEKINKKYKNKKILIVSHGCVLFSLQAVVKNLTEKGEMCHRKNLILKTGELRNLISNI
ncbi:MAG: histidine phosphatase family protein [bacterium]|nr:histidine phosphatase family protein [bacterium]